MVSSSSVAELAEATFLLSTDKRKPAPIDNNWLFPCTSQ